MKLVNDRFDRMPFFLAGLLVCLSLPSPARAQDLKNADLLHPKADSWPMYHGDYSGRRHVSFTQITPQNVGNLSLAWTFQTNQQAQIKSSPLLVDGILYFTVPDNIWAVDARSGHQIWHYHRPSPKGDHIGHRGVAMYKGWLYFTTPDCHLISLDARDGKVRWDKLIADVDKEFGHVTGGASEDRRLLKGLHRAGQLDRAMRRSQR